MKRLLLVFFIILYENVPALCKQSSVRAFPRIDIKELEKIEKILSVGLDDENTAVIKKELSLIEVKLKEIPVSKRGATLKYLAEQTKWGTTERYAAYYTCAWYGVNSVRCREYLTNATFWWERGFAKDYDNYEEYPAGFGDLGVDFLYKLYEHNHDFKLLHDIVTTQSDAGVAESIAFHTYRALFDHPRGILHIAEISDDGREFVISLLKYPPGDVSNPIAYMADSEDSIGFFRTYLQRVSKDRSDPLCKLAKDILTASQDKNH